MKILPHKQISQIIAEKCLKLLKIEPISALADGVSVKISTEPLE